MSNPYSCRHTERRPPLNHTDSKPPSTYWDKLSKVWLTKGALKELSRRKNKADKKPPPYRPRRRPVTRRILAKWAQRQRSAVEILDDFSEDELKGVKRLARQGGPDTTDLRGYPEPKSPLEHSTMPPTNHPSASKNEYTTNKTKTKTTSPYSRNFEQILIDNGVFPPYYEYPDGREPREPNNLDEIVQRARRRRSSLSPSRYTGEDFKKFQKAASKPSNEDGVSRTVITILEGSTQETYSSSTKVKFANLESIVDCPLTPGNPDLYDAAPPEQLDRRVRKRLYGMIVPSTQESHRILPNFFLHLKGPDGTEAVAQRQCVYDGALGERGQHQLRSYGTNGPRFDNNAHTITSVYLHGMLSMYTVYTAETNGPCARQEYYTHLIDSWAIRGNIRAFRDGAAAFRNLRDWAKEQRDEAIGLANRIVDRYEREENSGEEGAETNATSGSTLRAMGDGVGSEDDRTPPPTKRPSSASKRGRPSKRARTKR